jgi:hypothetical protein
MPPYVSTAIFEDALREVAFELARINSLIAGDFTADLAGLTSGETTIVEAINDSYPRHKIAQGEVITLPTNCTMNIAGVLIVDGLLINDGLIIEV